MTCDADGGPRRRRSCRGGHNRLRYLNIFVVSDYGEKVPVTEARRLVTELLKLLPELGRAMEAQCALQLSQLDRHDLPAHVINSLHTTSRPTPTQMQLAIELAQEGPATIRELAQRLGVTAAAVSLLVDRMVEHGWVERTRDTDDRRVVWVRLTPIARSISELFLGRQREQVAGFLRQVPEAEREAFVRNAALFVRVLGPANEARSPAGAASTTKSHVDVKSVDFTVKNV